MAFSTILFLLYVLPVFLVVFYLTPKAYRNVLILVVSMILYFWGDPKFFFILLGSIVADFYLSRFLEKESAFRKSILIFAILLDVGLLVVFKYTNFIFASLSPLVTLFSLPPLPQVHWLLPLGISFITFQKLSYLFDVYQKKVPATKKLSDLMLYLFMFPQILSGPITRYREMIPQILSVQKVGSWENRLSGLLRFCFGLSKKILIGNVLGIEADKVFAVDGKSLSFDKAWYGSFCYTFQIYFDFSGYSDMAIGLAKMMDYEIPENFDSPYISQNITEFWRRWHMTLGRFMRDYIYIPLGGNRGSAFATYRNLWLVFLVSGIWHGASWNFVLWGAFHGLFLVFDRLTERKNGHLLPAYVNVAITFFLVNFSWVLFRTFDLNQALHFYQAMFRFEWKPIAVVQPYLLSLLVIGALLSFLPYSEKIAKWAGSLTIPKLRPSARFFQIALALFLLALSIGEIASSKFSPFIYFRF
jgi:alginate O-acetyltransferase complex protein AlgI